MKMSTARFASTLAKSLQTLDLVPSCDVLLLAVSITPKRTGFREALGRQISCFFSFWGSEKTTSSPSSGRIRARNRSSSRSKNRNIPAVGSRENRGDVESGLSRRRLQRARPSRAASLSSARFHIHEPMRDECFRWTETKVARCRAIRCLRSSNRC